LDSTNARYIENADLSRQQIARNDLQITPTNELVHFDPAGTACLLGERPLERIADRLNPYGQPGVEAYKRHTKDAHHGARGTSTP
jgi:hypothetical protein